MKSQKESYRPVHSDLTSHKSLLRPDTEPEVYFIDEVSYENLIKIYSASFQHLQNVVAGYTTLGFGVITSDKLRQLSKRDFSQLEKVVYTDIEKNLLNLKKAGVTNPQMLENQRKDADQPYLRFKIRADLDLLNIDSKIDTDIYSLNNGSISFDDKAKARIREQFCTIRIDSQVKEQFQKLTEETLERLKQIKSILLKNGVNSIFGDGSLFNDTEGVILNKLITKFITK